MVVYKITNKLSGKSYVGQTIRLDKRVKEHASDKHDSAISLAIRKYGIDAFTVTILGSYADEETLNLAEDYFIDHHQTLSPDGYNLVTGQQKSRVWSEESRKKASVAKLGVNNPRFGVALTPEQRSFLAKLNRRPKTESHKQKLREANLGKKASLQARENMSKAAKASVNPGRFKKGHNGR